jgi:hypothetical protein
MASAVDPVPDFDEQFRGALSKAERGAILWSLAHHGSGLLSILASAAAAFLVATKPPELAGYLAAVIAALSGAAATLTTVSTFTGCAGKWRTNRTTRMHLRLLALDLDDADTEKLQDRFARIIREHERGITGAEVE